MIMKKIILMSIIQLIIFYIVHETFGKPNYYFFIIGWLIGGLWAIIAFDN